MPKMLIILALINRLDMPYFRIIVWTKTRKNPFSGIRWIETDNINLVQGMMEKKGHEHYRSNFIDCEVQMLSKTCSAVRRFLEIQNAYKKMGY